jgi:hypothetical protein
MKIEISCPKCEHRSLVPSDYMGKTVRCLSCSKQFCIEAKLLEPRLDDSHSAQKTDLPKDPPWWDVDGLSDTALLNYEGVLVSTTLFVDPPEVLTVSSIASVRCYQKRTPYSFLSNQWNLGGCLLFIIGFILVFCTSSPRDGDIRGTIMLCILSILFVSAACYFLYRGSKSKKTDRIRYIVRINLLGGQFRELYFADRKPAERIASTLVQAMIVRGKIS